MKFSYMTRVIGNSHRSISNFLLYKILPKSERVINYPWRIQIEPTTKCNLKCKMCPRFFNDIEIGDLSFKNYKIIIDKLPYTLYIMFCGLGETFLNKDIFKIFEYSKKKHIIFSTMTNATTLNSESIKNIVQSGLNTITISLDGPTKKSFEKIRIGANFERVIENTKALVEAKRKYKSKISIKVNSILTKYNYKHAMKYIDIAKETGVDRFMIKNLHYEPRLKEKGMFMNISNREKIFTKLKKRAEAENIPLLLPWAEKTQTIDNCYWPWSHVYIGWDGNVFPCCSIFENPMGNILKEDFKKIWNNEKYRLLRRIILKKGVPPQCKNCDYYKLTS